MKQRTKMMRQQLSSTLISFCSLFVITYLLQQTPTADAFTTPSVPSLAGRGARQRYLLTYPADTNTLPVSGRSSALSAQRKRRRKKGTSSSSPEDTDSTSSDEDDELPDFDFADDPAESTSTPVKKKPESSGGVTALGETKISANMMGSTNRPVRSFQELISDRALEKRFEFAEPEGEILPDLVDFSRGASSTPTTSVSKKQTRQDARRAAAMAAEKEREKEEESGFDLLSMLPGIRDESGNISATKFLESATWACIGALVVWEIFLNSPFFERAAQMVPVIY
jgi:hypothetical protein